MTSNVRKPSIILAGTTPALANTLRPIKETLELITGAGRLSELKGLSREATQAEIISKLNEVIRRLNASGGDHV